MEIKYKPTSQKKFKISKRRRKTKDEPIIKLGVVKNKKNFIKKYINFGVLL